MFLNLIRWNMNLPPSTYFIHRVYMTPGATRKQIKKRNRYKNNTRKNKHSVAFQLNPIPIEKIQRDFQTLQNMSLTNIVNTPSRVTLGNDIVDFFTLDERLHTKGHQKVSFYEFWNQRKKYVKKKYVRNMLSFYDTRKIDLIRKYKYIYNLYFSSITIFRPLMAMEIYARVKASRVLDFTMGWGGRLIAACAMKLNAYYGIDANSHLKPGYDKMTAFIKDEMGNTPTDIHLKFCDALTVDYSKMTYDTVFTSPPYYDLEQYRGSPPNSQYKTNSQWNEQFYKPLFEKTYKYLQKGGHYCINIPSTIYNEVCVEILGECTFQIPMKKRDRHLNEKYNEFIYVWKK